MSDNNPFADYSEHIEAPTHEALTKLTEKVDEQVELQAQEALLTEKLKEVQAKLQQVSERDIPELMEEIGLEDFKTKSGMQVEVKKATRANIKEENRTAAFAWLKATGNDAIIKNEITYSFGRGEDSVADALIDHVKGFDRPLTASKKQSVHAQTLGAFVRAREEAGDEIDESISVFHQTKAVVKAAK